MKSGLGEKLSELRREVGLSQSQAASNLNVSQSLLSHYETGSREPKLEFISRACDYYGVSADFLLGRTEARTFQDAAVIVDELESIIAKLKQNKSFVSD